MVEAMDGGAKHDFGNGPEPTISVFISAVEKLLLKNEVKVLY